MIYSNHLALSKTILKVTALIMALTLVAITVGAYLYRDNWAGWYPELFITVQNISVIFSSVMMAALFSWLGMQEGKSFLTAAAKFANPEAKANPLPVMILALIFAFAALSIPNIALILIEPKLFVSVKDSGFMPRIILWFSGSLSYLCFIALASRAIGIKTGFTLSPLILAVTAYLIILLPEYTIDSYRFDSVTVYNSKSWGYVWDSLPVVIERLVFWTALTTLIISASKKKSVMVSVSALLAAITLSVAILQGPNRIADIASADEKVCTNSAPIVCTDYLYSGALENYQELAKEIIDLLPPTANPAKVLVHPAAMEQAAEPEALTLAVVGDSKGAGYIPKRAYSIYRTLNNLLTQSCTEPQHQQVIAAVITNMSIRAGLSEVERASYEFDAQGMFVFYTIDQIAQVQAVGQQLAEIDKPRYDAWLANNWDAIATCTLSFSDMP